MANGMVERLGLFASRKTLIFDEFNFEWQSEKKKNT